MNACTQCVCFYLIVHLLSDRHCHSCLRQIYEKSKSKDYECHFGISVPTWPPLLKAVFFQTVDMSDWACQVPFWIHWPFSSQSDWQWCDPMIWAMCVLCTCVVLGMNAVYCRIRKSVISLKQPTFPPFWDQRRGCFLPWNFHLNLAQTQQLITFFTQSQRRCFDIKNVFNATDHKDMVWCAAISADQ